MVGALTAAVIGCTLPAVSFAVNDTSGNSNIITGISDTASVAVNSDEVRDSPKKFEGKWIVLIDDNGDLENGQSVRFRYTLTGSKLSHIDVSGSGNMAIFPVFGDSYIYNSAGVAKEVTVSIGAGITSIGNDWGGKRSTLTFRLSSRRAPTSYASARARSRMPARSISPTARSSRPSSATDSPTSRAR